MGRRSDKQVGLLFLGMEFIKGTVFLHMAVRTFGVDGFVQSRSFYKVSPLLFLSHNS